MSGAASAVDGAAIGVTPAAIAEWVARARPGERFVYFTGSFLLQTMPAVVAARRLADRGEVLTLQQRRPDARIDYFMQKRANVERRALSSSAVEGPSRTAVGRADEESELLMAVLRRLANLGQACPTNRQLAEAAELKDAESARYRMSLLSIAGRIRVETPPQGPRVITIVSSGRSTARGSA